MPRHLRFFEWLMYGAIVAGALPLVRESSWDATTFFTMIVPPVVGTLLTWAAARRGQTWSALLLLMFWSVGAVASVLGLVGYLWPETPNWMRELTPAHPVEDIGSAAAAIAALAFYFVGNARAGVYSKPPVPRTPDGVPQTVPMRETCANCRTTLVGLYCHNCSQSSAPALLDLREGANGLIKAFFRIDHKVLRTLRLVLFSPGKLSLEFHNGIYERYRPPLRFIFLISAIVMIALALTDIRLAQTYFVYGPDARVVRDADSVDLHDVRPVFAMIGRPGALQKAPPEFLASLERELARTTKDGWFERSLLRYWEAIALQDPRLSRWGLVVPLMVLAIAPLFAWLAMLFFRSAAYPFSDHLIFSIHIHAAALLFLLAVVPIVHLLPGGMLQHHFMMLYAALLTSYIVIACRTFYRESWIASIGKGLVLAAIDNFFIYWAGWALIFIGMLSFAF